MIYERQNDNGKIELYWREDSTERIIAHCDAWDAMYKKLGIYQMANKINKSRAYRIYKSRWPHDKETKMVIQSMPEDIEIAWNAPSPEEEAQDSYNTQILIDNLTPKQKKIFEALRDGKNSVEIENEQGYNTNNAIRWHKHQIKKKLYAIKHDKYAQLIGYVCRDCGVVFEIDVTAEQVCRCGSTDILKTNQRFKPIFED